MIWISQINYHFFCDFRRLRKTNSQKVLVCLAVSLLGLNLTFLLGIRQVHPRIGCYIVAAALHYFLLCSFAWMLVEAILQYLRIFFGTCLLLTNRALGMTYSGVLKVTSTARLWLAPVSRTQHSINSEQTCSRCTYLVSDIAQSFCYLSLTNV